MDLEARCAKDQEANQTRRLVETIYSTINNNVTVLSSLKTPEKKVLDITLGFAHYAAVSNARERNRRDLAMLAMKVKGSSLHDYLFTVTSPCATRKLSIYTSKRETFTEVSIMPETLEVPKSGLLLNSEPLKQIRDQYRATQSDGGDSDGNDSSDGND